ncbi:phospho-sugar mutase [Falsarthrobacter nasiphocae]|uniref:Phosphomannomutase n=1 Tax=Falsarthrobacter nasiphocae TaxID=189863 RepID=A0AAE4C5Z1_9MICC|nr:phospho-sugar mutase [Falsarthrobacter nasiphocae]MDR6891577.1 phosphomannomutase [Falsarthrobacter nasiphocae]
MPALTVLDRARAWLSADPDATSAEALAALIKAAQAGEPAALAELESAFAGNLAFGTAGLRAPIGPGTARMNVAVVRQTAAGLGRFLTEQAASGAFEGPARIVIGFDARHRSEDFARESAAVLVAAGHVVVLLPEPLPTPILAYALRESGADAGIMVTASHNPPEDNGYKVYLGGRVVTGPGQGAQIVPPFDAAIAAAIDHSEPANRIPVAESGWEILGDDVRERYLSAALETLGPATGSLRIVTTAMHGVGGRPLVDLLNRAGYAHVTPVAEQHEPDPDFPTVAFPNPEEPGAIDLALKTAEREDADLVIANDPDADRCAVAAVDPELGAWRMLRGDELGAVLGAWALERCDSDDADALVANSIVSSRLLGAMAAARGVRHAATLTGFKWIAREGGLRFGYEEAIGYLVTPELVRDKDGITAGLAIAHVAAALKAEGRTLFDVLDDLAAEFGVHLTNQLSIRVAAISDVAPIMERLRTAGPASLGGSPVAESSDLAAGYAGLPPTDGLLFLTEDGTRVIVRPSGTEPKLKAYIEAVVPVANPAALVEAKAEAARRVEAVRADLAAAFAL